MILLAALCAGTAVSLFPAARPLRVRRIRGVAFPFSPVLVGVGLLLLIGGAWGIVAGLTGTVLMARRAARRPRESDVEWDRSAPVVIELVAAATRVGVPPEGAVRAVAEAVGPPRSAGLLRVVEAWRYGLSALPTELDTASRAIAQAVERSRESGAAPAAALDRLAADVAAEAAVHAEQRARRVGVQAALPLGVCLLPAFLCLGVVPLIASLVSSVAR